MRQAWRNQAVCKGLDPAIFFPAVGGSSKEIKAICDSCPVKQECLEYALSISGDEDRCGIFAGTSARERSKMRALRASKRAAIVEPPPKPIMLVWDAKTETYRSKPKRR
jgi:WhiB family redox-sensing transcriptional regulator